MFKNIRAEIFDRKKKSEQIFFMNGNKALMKVNNCKKNFMKVNKFRKTLGKFLVFKAVTL